MVRKRCGKRRNFSLRAISPFPTVFSNDLYCRHVKARACLGNCIFYLKKRASKNALIDNIGFPQYEKQFWKRSKSLVANCECFFFCSVSESVDDTSVTALSFGSVGTILPCLNPHPNINRLFYWLFWRSLN